MKKFFKGIALSIVAFVCVFAFTACGDPISATTVDLSKVQSSNGVTTNGGITTLYDGYLYFINGTKTNDGKSSTGNKRSAIARVKLGADGKVDGSTYEILVDDLAGFNNGSLYFFGDYMYYTTPSSDVNSKDNVLYYKTKFMRYDLVNKKSYNIYTTKQNSSSESISYNYYIVGDSLNLIVFEKSNATITSVNINEECKTNYVIEGATSCVMSETYGQTVSGRGEDANSFIFYTTSNKEFDKYQTGVKVFRTTPTANQSVCLSDAGLSISLLCIRSGKLLFSNNSKIYCQTISSSTIALEIENYNNIISYVSYDDIVFLEIDDGISILYYDTKTYQIVLLTWKNGNEITSKPICELSKFTDFSFISLVTLTEEEKKDDAGTESAKETEGSETTPAKKYNVMYITYIADSYAYKLEIMRGEEGAKMMPSYLTKPVKLSTTKVKDASGMLIPEAVGNYFYVYVDELDSSNKATGHVYLYRLDLTITKDATSSDKPEFVGIREDGEEAPKK